MTAPGDQKLEDEMTTEPTDIMPILPDRMARYTQEWGDAPSDFTPRTVPWSSTCTKDQTGRSRSFTSIRATAPCTSTMRTARRTSRRMPPKPESRAPG